MTAREMDTHKNYVESQLKMFVSFSIVREQADNESRMLSLQICQFKCLLSIICHCKFSYKTIKTMEGEGFYY